jgi:hypothetical protein
MLASIETFRWECSGRVNGRAGSGAATQDSLDLMDVPRSTFPRPTPMAHGSNVPSRRRDSSTTLSGNVTGTSPRPRLEPPLGDIDQHQRALTPPPFEKPQVAPVRRLLPRRRNTVPHHGHDQVQPLSVKPAGVDQRAHTRPGPRVGRVIPHPHKRPVRGDPQPELLSRHRRSASLATGPSRAHPLALVLVREQGSQTPHFFDQARYGIPRHGDEGRVLVPAFIADIDVARMLDERRRDQIPVIEVRPTLAGTGSRDRADRDEIHGGVVVQGPDMPRSRGGGGAQLLDLLEFFFTHRQFHRSLASQVPSDSDTPRLRSPFAAASRTSPLPEASKPHNASSASGPGVRRRAQTALTPMALLSS